MPDTHDFGRLFVHSIYLSPDAPLVHRAITAEYDFPSRFSRSFVVRLPFSQRGIVIGWWRHSEDEWRPLMEATRLGHEPDGNDDANLESPTRESLRSALTDVAGRRVADAFDAGARGQ